MSTIRHPNTNTTEAHIEQAFVYLQTFCQAEQNIYPHIFEASAPPPLLML